jgi:hypothetical protein
METGAGRAPWHVAEQKVSVEGDEDMAGGNNLIHALGRRTRRPASWERHRVAGGSREGAAWLDRSSAGNCSAQWSRGRRARPGESAAASRRSRDSTAMLRSRWRRRPPKLGELGAEREDNRRCTRKQRQRRGERKTKAPVAGQREPPWEMGTGRSRAEPGAGARHRRSELRELLCAATRELKAGAARVGGR